MIGQTLSGCRILEQIGMGGMATVYKAYDPGTDRYVAIKILPEYFSRDPSFQERFRREAKAIARLEHPHILPIHSYGEENGIAYLVMRYLPAGTLKQRIENGGVSLTETAVIIRQLADALDYAHECGVLHRDIKPSNVLLDEKGNVYLADFGIAHMVESSSELTGSALLGTPAYMSPEQCQGSRSLTPASDQYALGIVLYEMVTGRTPFQAETPIALIHMHLSEPLPPPSRLRPGLPEDIEKTILKSLARDPLARWPSCGALAEAFGAALPPADRPAGPSPIHGDTTTARRVAVDAGETIPAPPLAAARRAVQPRRGLPAWLWGIVGLVALTLIVGGAILLGFLGSRSSPVAQSPTLTPAAQGPTSAPAASEGEILQHCGNDLCIVSPSKSTKLGLDSAYTVYPSVAWSPDGQRIAFTGCPGKNVPPGSTPDCSGNLYLVSRDGSHVTPIFSGRDVKIFGVSWSPDGGWIAADSNGLAVFHPDGAGRQVLVPRETTVAQATAWSPDSRQIAWIGGTCGYKDCTSDQVLVVNRDGSGMKLLYVSTGDHFQNQIAWSPDGKSVVIVPSYGITVRIAVDCAAGPSGCDASSRTRLDSLPDSWLPTFYPPWAGAAGAPGSTP